VPPGNLRIAIVDDHPLFVRGLELLLPSVTEGRAVVAGTAADASAAAGLVLRCAPDLALVDLHMPPPGGVRAIAAILRAAPQLRVVAMSGLDDPELILAALRAGAQGYLPKTSEPDDLLPPLQAVLEGWTVLPPGVLAAILEPFRAQPRLPRLDEPDRHLWRLIAEGASTVEIGLQLHVSERTVKRLTANLLRKLQVSSRPQAAALAGQTGLLEGSESSESRGGPSSEH
jgi:two-component system, NarL family, nitrate/nitrite response regulator NarL